MSSRDDSERKLASMAEMGVSKKPHQSVRPLRSSPLNTQIKHVLGLTTRKLVPSAVRWPTPARMKPVTVSSSPITPTSLVPSLILFSVGKSFWPSGSCKVRNAHLNVTLLREFASWPTQCLHYGDPASAGPRATEDRDRGP